jgi:phage head maturation protease
MESTSLNKAEKNNLVRELAVSGIRQVEDNERRFILSFSSEEPYERWFGAEILDHSEGAVDLTRLNEIGVLLYNHNRDKVIGKVVRAWIENGRGNAEIEFDTDEESEVIRQKVAGGTLRGVSVGYIVTSWEEVAANKKSSDGRFEGPCSIGKSWCPHEISIVSIPADPTVGVGRDFYNNQERSSGFNSKSALNLGYFENIITINQNKLRR